MEKDLQGGLATVAEFQDAIALLFLYALLRRSLGGGWSNEAVAGLLRGDHVREPLSDQRHVIG